MITGLLRRLWRPPAASHPFRPLAQMCTAWADEFEGRREHLPLTVDSLNCPQRLFRDPRRLCQRMADLLDLDLGRLEQWLFARCIQESADNPALLHVAEQLAPT